MNLDNKFKKNRRIRHQENDAEKSFDMASYRQGVTLSKFSSDNTKLSERKKLNRLRVLRRRLLSLFVVVAGLFVFCLAVMMQFCGDISDVIVVGENSDGIRLSDTDKNHYKDIVNSYFSKNSFERLGFIRRSSVLKNYVFEVAPEIKSVHIKPAGIAQGNLVIELRKPVATWVNGGKASFVDSNGVVFSRNYFTMPLVAIEDNSGIKLDGRLAASANFLGFVGKLVVNIESQGAKVQRVTIPKGSVRYIELFLQDRPYPFKAQIDRDAASQASDIMVMTRYIDNNNIKPQYVDVRIPSKAYWK